MKKYLYSIMMLCALTACGHSDNDEQRDMQQPADIDPGHYHFMIRLTDRAGWQQLHSVAVIIVDTKQ